MKDLVYCEPCGCVITFFAASEYSTSRMDPGAHCLEHTRRHQRPARDEMMRRARKWKESSLNSGPRQGTD